ncbi:Flagellar autotomy protein 1 [Volvox africanus]|uniref:Flagellar autotomy protein 1 n=1 Tax=Volvox africanus TaxID=51714 RepID=A0ABQ5S0C1_9CHLO|nr:Flagellar autotomy protein 1 [Volvox africanus]
MAPKAVSLAFAGRKLTGPPEGYGKKKEFQVKRWISGMPPPEELDPTEVGSVATFAEIESSKDDLYRSLRDSTDGFYATPPPPPAAGRPGGRVPERASGLPTALIQSPQQPRQLQQQQQQQSSPQSLVAAAAAAVPIPASPGLRPATGSRNELGSLGVATSTAAGGGTVLAAAAGPTQRSTNSTLTSPPAVGDAAGTFEVQNPTGSGAAMAAGVAALSPARTALASSSMGRLAAAAAVVAAAVSGDDTERSNVSISTSRQAPLDLGVLEATGAGDGANTATDVGVAAAILMARVEATLPSGVPAEEKLRAALLLALEEHLRFQDNCRSELAAVRALAAEARAEAKEREADVHVAVRRAVQAEEELGKARADALTYKQQAQRLQIDLDEHRDSRDEQLTRAQSELAAAVAQLKEQSARSRQAMEESAAEAAAARSAVATLQREVAVLRRQQQQDKLKMEAMTVSLQASLEAERREAAAARAERDRSTKQAETQEAVQATAAAAQAAKQRMATATQRAAVVRAADPSAAAISVSAAAAAASGGTAGADAARGGSPRSGSARATGAADRQQHQQQQPPATALTTGASSPSSARGKLAVAAPPSPGDVGVAAPAAAAIRAEGHRALSRGLAAERLQLGELVQLQRRAAAAAELADARVVEAALTAAPEHLRLLGLAFRAYVVGGSPDDTNPPGGRLQEGRLTSLGFRAYVDPLTLTQGPPSILHEVPSAPLVGRAAAVVVLAVPGLLKRPLACGELSSAARHGCRLVVLSPPDLVLEDLTAGEAPPLAGSSPELKLDLAMEAVREAWPSRITMTLDAPGAPAAVAARLGLPDPKLALLPPEALRQLSVTRTGVMPDLAFLNVPQLPLGPGGGGGLVAAAAASLPGLQHLRLSFGAGGGGSSGGGAAAGPLVEMLCAVLQGNSTLTALTLRGCPAAAARTLTETALANPVCRISTITISSRVPVAQLAGRSGRPAGDAQRQAIDLGAPAGGHAGGGAAARAKEELPFTDEDAESCNLRLGFGAVATLAAALAGLLPGLESVNGVLLQGVITAARSGSVLPAAAGDSRTGAGGGGGVLDLSGSRCGPLPLAVLAEQLQSALPVLPALNLTGCEVGPMGAAFLAEAAEAGVKKLGNVTGSGLAAMMSSSDSRPFPGGGSDQGGTAASAALSPGGSSGSSGSCCAVLDVSLNGLGDVGCKALSRRLPALGSALRVLALSHNGIGTEGARALGAALAACGSLKELILAGNQFGDQAIRELQGALQRLQGLKVLQLQDNPRISSDGMAALAAALAGMPSLEELDLSRCYAGDEGVRHLSKALATHPALTALALEGCKIRADGAVHLAAALGIRLVLGRNQLGDRGVAALAAALGRNSSLTSLDLRSNGVGLAGCRSLGAALRERNTTVRQLAMAGNEMEDEALQALEDLASARRSTPLRAPSASSPAAATAEAGAPSRDGTSPAGTPARSRTAQPATAGQTARPAERRLPFAVAVESLSSAKGIARAVAANLSVPGAGSSRQQLLQLQRPPASEISVRRDRQSQLQPHRLQHQMQMPGLGLCEEGEGEGEGEVLSASAALTAALSSTPLLGMIAAGSRDTAESATIAVAAGARGHGVGGVGGVVEEEEDLEELLNRYRTSRRTLGDVGESVTRKGSRDPPPGGLMLDLGYTGMQGH